jgi:hypothetical protein
MFCNDFYANLSPWRRDRISALSKYYSDGIRKILKIIGWLLSKKRRLAFEIGWEGILGSGSHPWEWPGELGG